MKRKGDSLEWWVDYYREQRDDYQQRYYDACDRNVSYIVRYTLALCVLIVTAAVGWLEWWL